MLTSQDCLARYGDPYRENHMVLWDVPAELEVGVIPKRLYCNKDMVKPLSSALHNLINTGAVAELKTFDGCFNIRRKKGGTTMSLHSWGVAIDVNAAWNAFGAKPTLSELFVSCFTDVGFVWGGTWTKPDGMHFQLEGI